MNLLLVFIGLQVLDVLTTVLFLHNGVREANPIVRAVLAGSTSPGLALLPAKAFAIALGGFAWYTGRKGLLWKMNLLFALCVAWNLVAAAVGRA